MRSFALVALGALLCGGLCVVSTAGRARADEVRGNDTPMAFGFNIDLVPTLLDAADPDIGYTPQFWLGFGRSRLRFDGEELEIPAEFTKAVQWFSPPATDEFESMQDDPVVASPGAPEGTHPGVHLGGHLGRHLGVRRLSARLSIKCGAVWRLRGDTALEPRAGILVLLPPAMPQHGSAQAPRLHIGTVGAACRPSPPPQRLKRRGAGASL